MGPCSLFLKLGSTKPIFARPDAACFSASTCAGRRGSVRTSSDGHESDERNGTPRARLAPLLRLDLVLLALLLLLLLLPAHAVQDLGLLVGAELLLQPARIAVSTRSESTQNPKINYPAPPLLETTRIDGVKAP